MKSDVKQKMRASSLAMDALKSLGRKIERHNFFSRAEVSSFTRKGSHYAESATLACAESNAILTSVS